MVRRLLVLLGVAVFGGVLALAIETTTASAHTYDFASCAQSTGPFPCTVNMMLGPTLQFVSNNDVITVNGFDVGPPATPEGLFVKNEGPGTGQNGIGIGRQIFNEIDPTEFASFDLSKLASEGITNGFLSVESVTPSAPLVVGEQFQVCNSTTDNVLCSASTSTHVFGANGLNGPDSWGGNVVWTAANPFLQITGVNVSGVASDVLVGSLATAEVPVPEPTGLALIATGLVGLVFARYRRVF